MRFQPLVIHDGDDAKDMLGAEVFCENGHYAFTIGPVPNEVPHGWPELRDRSGANVTEAFIGKPMPLLCAECGAITMRMDTK